MNLFEGELAKQVGQVVTAVVGTLLAGMGIRRLGSKDARDRAKAKAEETYFETAVGKMEKERDLARAEEVAALHRVREIEVENSALRVLNATLESQLLFQKRILSRYPELQDLFESEPAEFDDRPVERVFSRNPGDG